MPMPHSVERPLVIQHKRCIYVLGGYDDDDQMLSKVAQYNIEDDTWKECEEMPEVCESDESGVVVHKNKIKVITTDKCMMYDDDTDTWTFYHYVALGDRVNAFIKKGQIWAVVYNFGSEHGSTNDDADDSGQSSISSEYSSESILTDDGYDCEHDDDSEHSLVSSDDYRESSLTDDCEHSLMSYDDVNNVWKHEMDVVAWDTDTLHN